MISLCLILPFVEKKRNEIEARPTATFQKAFKSTLFIGQIFSSIPVVSICSEDVNDVR